MKAYNASKTLVSRLRSASNSLRSAKELLLKILGFINRNFSFKNKDTILPMYIA